MDQEEEQAVLDVMRAKRLFRFSGHEDGESKADRFEREFASSVGAAHALAVTSGTAALISGLQGIGIGPGDEVILPAYTWMASATAVMAVGGIPVIVSVVVVICGSSASYRARGKGTDGRRILSCRSCPTVMC